MKSKLFAGLMSAAIVLAAAAFLPGKTGGIFSGSTITAEASCVLDQDNGVLTLSGNVSKEEISAYSGNGYVKSVVAESGTVFPESCKELFSYFSKTNLV